MPMPGGIPDEVAVVCNGLKGSMLLRTQNVRLAETGEEVSASKFEELGGKREWEGQPSRQM